MSNVQLTLKFQYKGGRAGKWSSHKNHEPPTREYMDELHRDLSVLRMSSPSRLDGCWQSGTVECIWYAVKDSELYKKLLRGYARRNKLINVEKNCIKWIQLIEVNLGNDVTSDSTASHSSSSSGPGKVSTRKSSTIYLARKFATELSRPTTSSRHKHRSPSSSSHRNSAEDVRAVLAQCTKLSEDFVPLPALADRSPSPVRQIMSSETIDRLDRTHAMLRRLSESEDTKEHLCLASSEVPNVQERQPSPKSSSRSMQIPPARTSSIPATPSGVADDPPLIVKDEMSASPRLPTVGREETASNTTHKLCSDNTHPVGEETVDRQVASSSACPVAADSLISPRSDLVIKQMQNKFDMLQEKLQEQQDARSAAEAALQGERQRHIQAESSLEDQLQGERDLRQVAESALQEERQRRVQAEKVIEDMRRECHTPFVVPALMDAFVKLAQLTSEAVHVELDST